MTPLQFPFIRDGFTHELLERHGLICLVKRSKPTHWHYEVVRLKIRPAEERFGKWYPERESYPSNEEWGTYGFTYLSTELERARKRHVEPQKGGLASSEGKDSGPLPPIAPGAFYGGSSGMLLTSSIRRFQMFYSFVPLMFLSHP
jgi:hypothetical protein